MAFYGVVLKPGAEPLLTAPRPTPKQALDLAARHGYEYAVVEARSKPDALAKAERDYGGK